MCTPSMQLCTYPEILAIVICCLSYNCGCLSVDYYTSACIILNLCRLDNRDKCQPSKCQVGVFYHSCTIEDNNLNYSLPQVQYLAGSSWCSARDIFNIEVEAFHCILLRFCRNRHTHTNTTDYHNPRTCAEG